jgi:hypothetical protein
MIQTNNQNIQAILTNVRGLSLQEQLDLLEQIAAIVHTRFQSAQHSILELDGLGAEIWRGVNSQRYVNEERTSWDG